MRGRLRLTWFELGVVVATLGLGATVAGADRASRRRERRIEENEAAAVATLRLIAEAQERFRAEAHVDVDGDGVGEYGVFRELAGMIALRTNSDGTNTGGTVLSTPLLPSDLARLDLRAQARRRGYLFKIFLAGEYGAVEEQGNGLTDTLDGSAGYELAERTWCAYAWPVRRGRSGRRCFFIHQDGVVTSTSQRLHRTWTGQRTIDEGNAGSAFEADGGWLYSITGTQALGTVGRDGNFWRVVE